MYTEEQVRKAIDMARTLEETERGKKIEWDVEGLMGLTEICTHGMWMKYDADEIIKAIQK